MTKHNFQQPEKSFWRKWNGQCKEKAQKAGCVWWLEVGHQKGQKLCSGADVVPNRILSLENICVMWPQHYKLDLSFGSFFIFSEELLRHFKEWLDSDLTPGGHHSSSNRSLRKLWICGKIPFVDAGRYLLFMHLRWFANFHTFCLHKWDKKCKTDLKTATLVICNFCIQCVDVKHRLGAYHADVFLFLKCLL